MSMKESFKKGFSFGITSAIITTLGLMVGLSAGTNSKTIVIGGILTIAVADAFSDSLGIHISEEAENVHSEKEIWATTLFTFLSKFVFAVTFVVPVLLFDLTTAIYVSIAWGLFLLTLFNIVIARANGTKARTIVAEHISIAIVVIVATSVIGQFIAQAFV